MQLTRIDNPEVDQEQVRNALAQLPDRQRDVICRSYCFGRTTAQIAAELGVDERLVKQELHKALHALRVAFRTCSDGLCG